MNNAAALRERLSAVWRGDEFSRLVATLETYLPEEDLEGIVDAYELSARAHEGQQRSSTRLLKNPIGIERRCDCTRKCQKMKIQRNRKYEKSVHRKYVKMYQTSPYASLSPQQHAENIGKTR